MVWGTDLLGGATPGDCIPNGPFAGLLRTLPVRRCVWRGFTAAATGNSMGGQTFEDAGTIQAAIAAPTPYSAFRVAIEIAHGSPHGAIGAAQLNGRLTDPALTGEMRLPPLSSSDPVFYVHHAYVDSLWARRQGAAGRSSTEYGGGGASPLDLLPPFGTATVANTFHLPCVRYQDPLPAALAGEEPPEVPPGGGATPTPTPPPAEAEREEAKAAVVAEREPRAAVQAEFARAVGQSEAEVAEGEELLAEAATDALLDGTLAVRLLGGGGGGRWGRGIRLVPRHNGTAAFW